MTGFTLDRMIIAMAFTGRDVAWAVETLREIRRLPVTVDGPVSR